VIAAVKRVSKRDFEVRTAERREGDPPALVANADRIQQVLGWEPRLDDLDTIVAHALAWEQKLHEKRAVSAN
jgi:UDP-glucose 4-epimerase